MAKKKGAAKPATKPATKPAKPAAKRKPRSRAFVTKNKQRNDQRRAAWMGPYVEAVEKCGQLAYAAKLVGIHRQHVWEERKKNREFRIAVADALRLYRERHVAELEEEIFRRAKHKTPGEMDTKALIAALRAMAPERWNPAKTQNVNLGGQPGNQLPESSRRESSITVIRLVDINSHDDAKLFRQMQEARKVIEERGSDDEDGESPAPAITHNGNGNGKTNQTTTNGKTRGD